MRIRQYHVNTKARCGPMKYILMHREIPVLEMELDSITGGITALGRLFEPERVPVGISVNMDTTR